MKTFNYFAIVGCMHLVLSPIGSAGERFILTTGSVTRQLLPETQVALTVSVMSPTGRGGGFQDLEAERDKTITDFKSNLKEEYGESGWMLMTKSIGVSTGPKGRGAHATIIVVLDGHSDPRGVLDYATGRQGMSVLWTGSGYSDEEAARALVDALNNAR